MTNLQKHEDAGVLLRNYWTDAS